MKIVRRHLGTAIVAMVVAAVTAAAPALAHQGRPSAPGDTNGPSTTKKVVAGAHFVRPNATDEPTLDRFFNNVNGNAPTISGSSGTYDINMGFKVAKRFALCSIDTNYVDTRDALCTVSTPGGKVVRVRVWDTGTQSGPAEERNAEFWVIVYG